MSKWIIFSFFLSQLLYEEAESQFPTIGLELSKNSTTVGENLTLTCTLTGLDSDSVTFVKRIIQNGGHFIDEQISLNDILTKLYSDLKRFTIKKTTDGGSHVIILRITGVQLEDSGNYGCSVPSIDNLSSLKVFEVYRRPKSISFVMNGNQSEWDFVVRENETLSVVCRVSEVLPEPSLSVWSDDETMDSKDITDEFSVTSHQNIHCREKSMGKPCPLHESLTMEATNERFVVPLNRHKTKLKCISKMKSMDEEEIKTEITIRILFAPRIVCREVWSTVLNSTDFVIRCRIYANPPVNDSNRSVSIKEPNGNVVLVKPGNNFTFYGLQSEVIRSSEGTETVMSFTIKTVTKSHFNSTYTFYAANSEGETNKIIRLTATNSVEGILKRRSQLLLPSVLFVYFVTYLNN